ncbi:MAG: DNA repair protein RadA [Patescibacteria group bacterium]|nr:MAG: DNA repair protein RadA [Patescibacteria group bacterium]
MVKKKIKTSFVCQQCGYDSPAYLGKCPECGLWNTFAEFKQPSSAFDSGSSWVDNLKQDLPRKLSDIAYKERLRIQTKFNELNTVLGGGIVVGSATLLAGDPGVGKSTLLLQLCLSLAQKGLQVLYISGEESIEQIKMRADRLIKTFNQKSANNSPERENVQISDSLFLISLSDPDIAFSHIQSLKPDLVIVDSIQTMQSTNLEGLSGSVGQVRYAALHFIRAAKQFNIPVILVGHVTKEGMVAGPMVLSHMVDTVLFLEGEKFTKTRILRSLKNRFGPVDEVGIFIMDEEGLKEIANPEQIFLSQRSGDVPGTVLVVTMEGSRAFLVELQALVVSSKLPMPRRVVSGVDQKRVELLLAVLQKHCGLPLDTMDVFVNVAGGLKISDPAIDLGVCLAIYSSIKNISLSKIVGIAEVGLLGELREVSSLEKRIKEAKKLGFTNILTVKSSKFLNDVLKSLESKK